MILSLPILFLVATALGDPGHEIAHTEHDTDPPLIVTLDGPAKVHAGQRFELVLTIARVMPDAVPLEVELDLPAGVELVSAPFKGPIVEAEQRNVVRTLRFEAGAVPERDLRVTVRAETRRWGAQATASYRFGRSAPERRIATPGPALTGPGGIALARPIALVPRALSEAPGAIDAAWRRGPTGKNRDLTPPVGARR